MGDLLQLAIYNPCILKDEDFITGFVARHELANDIINQLRNITRRSLAKHKLILGQRGMGKTSLLRRIAIGIRSDPQLSEILLPLSFREEQYNVHNLHTFWCNCLDALGDYFEVNKQHEKAQAIDDEVAALTRRGRDNNSDEDGEEALAALKAWAKSEGKRLLLLLDNIDLILNGLAEQHWSLRRTLQEAGGIVVIGATASYLEVTADPKGAFYDFFQVTVLERLTPDELLACLRRLAKVRGVAGKKVLQVLNTDPGRIRTLYDLTGGNLRTLVLLYILLEQDTDDDVMNDLERLLDEVTVLYKARVEDLAPQARVVLDAVALAWNPITAADVAAAIGMDTSAVSAQLDRLSKSGVVEKVTVSTTIRNAFQLGERFFNIWYLMRHGPRRQRTRLRWLTGFLRGFYSPEQLTEKATTLLKGRRSLDEALSNYYLALSDLVDDKHMRNLLGHEARRELERLAAKQGKCLQDLVDPKELPAPETSKDWFGVGRLLHLKLVRYEEAEAAYRKAIELDPKYALPWNGLGNLLKDPLGRYENAEAAYRKAIELDPKYAIPWNGLGNLLKDFLARHEEAEAAYRKAIELDPKYARPWNGLGNLLQYHLARYGDAEAAYRKAIKLDPEYALPWHNLGSLLQYHLARYEEAETAYRKAIELDPKYTLPWNNLGNLLQYRLARYEDAEAAYSKAIELDPEYALPWSNRGNLLQYRLARYEEAETSYRKAIELDPEYALPWSNLGNLLQYRLARYQDAEAAYRRAIELNPKSSAPWNDLGNLLKDFLARYEDAEAAYRKAIELDPKYTLPWNNLGNLLQYRLARYEEAEAAYRKAIELDPKYAIPWNNLGKLLQHQLARYEDAEAAYRKAIEFDPEFASPMYNLGYLSLYYLDKPDEAESAYLQALSLEPNDLVAVSNLLALHLTQANRRAEAEAEFEIILPMHSPQGASLLLAIKSITEDNFGAATAALKDALISEPREIFDTYGGFLILFLRLATQRGYGEKLLKSLDDQGLTDRYWPLRVAFDAYLHGDARLMDINPEVRGAAKRIYEFLDFPRRYRNTPSDDETTPTKNRKKTRPN